LGILTILLIAFALRAYRIDGQSLWYDEGVSVAMAPRDLLAIAVDAAADIHPPLYYYLLHFWTAVFGTSEFAVRWLSLTFGVALVATVLLFRSRLLGDRVGLVAAFLTAISTLLIYYSQETRMYMQVAFFGSLSTYLFLRVQPEFGASTICVEVDPASPTGEHPASPKGEHKVRPYVIAERDRRSNGCGARLWAAYIVASAALLYSHYFAFAMLALQDLWVGISVLLFLVASRARSRDALTPALSLWEREIGYPLPEGEGEGVLASPVAASAVPGVATRITLAIKQLAKWVGVQIVIVATFVPWLVITFGQIGGWPGISEQFDFPTLLHKVFLVFTFGLSWDAAATSRKEEFFLFLIAVAIALPLFVRTRRKVGGIAFATLYFLIPVAIMYLLSLRKPMYNPKFLLLATPGYYILLAAGLVGVGQFATSSVRRIGRPLPVVLSIAVGGLVVGIMLVGTVFSTGKSTAAYYFNPKYARDDYRGVARFIQANSEPGDAVILNAPGQLEIFGYYFRDKEPVFPLPGERPINKQNTENALKDITGRNKRVWLVLWAQNESDPDGFIERWLDENSFKSSNVWFGGIRLALYSTAQNAAQGQSFEPDVNFGNKIRLTGARIGSAMARPGDVVEITLNWQAIEPINERYTVFVHIVDGHDYLWGQRDSEPGGGNKITNSWRVGETVEDRHGVAV
ncbi:MAG: glycosyltransferase family 39 protein, partial [Chloroflexi bacterium]|nr:glycosyltransferase family 39 protein [Chloroflexota bacterium]